MPNTKASTASKFFFTILPDRCLWGTGTFSLHRLFWEIPKRLCFKERSWGANSLARNERQSHREDSLWVQTLEEQTTVNIPFPQLIPCNSQSTHVFLVPAVSFWSLPVWWMMTRQGYDTIGSGTTSSTTIIFRCQGKTFWTLQSTAFLFITSTFLQPSTAV